MKKIPLTRGKFALVDDEDYELVSKYKWVFSRYARHDYWDKQEKKYKQIFMHRLIIDAPKNKYVDHINRNPLDNRKENLRLATKQQNNINVPKRKGQTSKYKGVCWHKKRERWVSNISIDKKLKHIGYYKSEKEAGMAYNKYAKEYFGEFAYLNDIEGD